ncbi:MAG: radical SAM protein, partial [Syntrophobacteraceae bacterium]
TQALKRSPHNPDFWVLRERGRDEVFPWEIIDNGVKRGYLWDELQRAIEARETPECKPGDKGCKRCGVCGEGRS